MNREIKFRGFSEELKCFVYGFFHEVEAEGIGYSYIFWQGHTTPVRADSVSQFTGLYNEKLEEIYEDDIVKVGGLIEVVTYINGILCCYNERIYGKREKVKIDTFEDVIVASSDYFEPYEIIGNVFENPDLLPT